jgi:hypothetical protein
MATPIPARSEEVELQPTQPLAAEQIGRIRGVRAM